MRIRSRLFIAFLILAGLGFYGLVDWVLDDLRPRYLETMEESMVDMATLLSSYVANQMDAGPAGTGSPADELRAAFDVARKRSFSARIYEVTKTHINMRVYITDRNGIVVFDSDDGRDEGKDYSRWNDVVRTLRGEYGARATRGDPDDPTTSVLHVASPILIDGEIAGVLTVCKPADSVTQFLDMARWKITVAGLKAAVVVVLLGMAVSFWITRPIEKLTRYAKAVRDGRRVPPPRLGRGEIGALGQAFEEMRTALEGKQYVEDYVQTLTHEMKSPLSAIRGAAELLEEDMPPAQRRQFLANLRSESARIQGLVDRMLELSAIENRNQLAEVGPIDLAALIAEIAAGLQPVLSARGIAVDLAAARPVVIQGERFLLRQALVNLIQNAVDFSGDGATVSVSVAENAGWAEIAVVDNGPGVPAYALERVFDRFYSLQRPATGKKSSGLGLVFVREAATLHGGRASLENRPEGGAKATLILPVEPQQPEF
ncbi:MAG: two-component system sensor histidine kinase CreC [Candidatus Hydrogenedentes bacterium]|nr:two-component system sensor histidine kinase CreC [Candidatus Hydrogenedentota bacterium]